MSIVVVIEVLLAFLSLISSDISDWRFSRYLFPSVYLFLSDCEWENLKFVIPALGVVARLSMT